MLETKNHNKNGHAALLKNGLKSRERESTEVLYFALVFGVRFSYTRIGALAWKFLLFLNDSFKTVKDV